MVRWVRNALVRPETSQAARFRRSALAKPAGKSAQGFWFLRVQDIASTRSAVAAASSMRWMVVVRSLKNSAR
jgi:hypothetical protein